jgi:hypothetical protein
MPDQAQFHNKIVIQVRLRKQCVATIDKYHNVSRWVKSYFRSFQIKNKEGLIFRIGEAVKIFKTDI